MIFDNYAWRGGREALIRFGSAHGPAVITLLPLFEEANRTRAFAVTLLRHLANLGVTGLLPDLPGTGESLVPSAQASLADMRAAVAALAETWSGPLYTLGIRSGALLDSEARVRGRWHFAPMTGAELDRELTRLAPAMARPQGMVEVAGHLLSATMRAEIRNATLEPDARILRFESDPRPADDKLPGAPLWRRVEPDNDPVLAALLAEDIAQWLQPCDA